MTVSLSLLAGAGWQFFDDNGNPLSGGLLYTYEAGTTTPVITYTSSAGTTANSNPVVLDAAGRVPEQIWLNTAYTYKFLLRTSTGVSVWSKDNIPATSAATTISSALVEFVQAGAGAVARTVQSKLRDTVSVKDFGAVGDGVTDDTAAIVAAVAAANGTVLFPAGTYRVTSTITITKSLQIVGEGRGSTIISHTSDINVFSFVGFSSGWEIGNLSIKRVSGTATSGAAINIDTASNGMVDNVYIESTYIGVNVSSSQSVVINKADVWYFKGQGIRFYGNNNNDVFVSNCFINGESSPGAGTAGAGWGIRLEDKCEAITFYSMEVVLCAYALVTGASSYTPGNRPAYCRFTSCFFDSSTSGVLLDKAVEFTFTSCWFSNRPGNGCLLNQTQLMTFVGCTFANNAQHGCVVQSASERTTFSDCKFVDNSTAAAGTYNGLTIAANTTDFVVRSCVAGPAIGFSNNQGYGIFVGSGCDNFVIDGCNLRYNLIGFLSDNSSATANKTIHGNIGYRTSNTGQGTILAGATTVTVNHGLGVTPRQQDIMLTRGGGNAGSTDLYVNGITSTQFVINTAAAPSVNMPVNWMARCSGA